LAATPVTKEWEKLVNLGTLERAVMEALWTSSAESPESGCTARAIAVSLPNHAYTTVLTVLDRLTRKGLVERLRDGRSHHYRPTGSRESYVAEVMLGALDATSDRDAALVHFAEAVSPDQARVLRDVLRRLEQSSEPCP
jgi:predicted transcriptional regulator